MIGARLREMRVSAGLSQTELARRLGVVDATVSQWQSEARTVSFVDVARWASECGFEVRLERPALEVDVLLEHLRGDLPTYADLLDRARLATAWREQPVGSWGRQGFERMDARGGGRKVGEVRQIGRILGESRTVGSWAGRLPWLAVEIAQEFDSASEARAAVDAALATYGWSLLDGGAP